jgi:outer membrane protein OmpA-like peptidoglycan-associated protein
MDGGAVMRRHVQIICIAGAVVVAGGSLWAIAGSDILESFGLSSPAPTSEASTAAVSAAISPRTRRSVDALAIEIARIDAGGVSVIAGRSPPNHRVVVLANGREIAAARATDEGQWSVIISEGIAAGPLELSVSSKPESGGPAVVSTPRYLVVPPAGSGPRLAGSSPVKVWAPPMAAGMQPPAKIASTPAERPQPNVVPHAESRAKAASDKQALDQFAALVERARTDAAAVAKREGPAANALGVIRPPASGGSAPATPAIVTAAATGVTPVTPARAAETLPDPAQVPIPVPITFMTDDTELTPDGTRAAALLAEYLRLKRPEGISLSGHADARGDDDYNMDLSKRRLEAIERYLRQAGYTGSLSLIPKGKREPYLGVDRNSLSLNEVYQADRRVELRLTR